MRFNTVKNGRYTLHRFFTAILISCAFWFVASVQPSLSDEALDAPDPLVLVMLGDSITAGYGLPEEEALPIKLQAWLTQQGHAIEIRNAGISGDTTAGGRERVDWSVDEDVDVVMVALGGNDLLRAIPPSETEKNLNSILQQLRTRNIDIILAGMIALPNYGPEYGDEFNTIYPRLAETYGAALYPFFLEGIAADPAFNQPDGIHPNVAGVTELVNRIGPFLAKTLFTTEDDLAQTKETP